MAVILTPVNPGDPAAVVPSNLIIAQNARHHISGSLQVFLPDDQVVLLCCLDVAMSSQFLNDMGRQFARPIRDAGPP